VTDEKGYQADIDGAIGLERDPPGKDVRLKTRHCDLGLAAGEATVHGMFAAVDTPQWIRSNNHPARGDHDHAIRVMGLDPFVAEKPG
jgi:hypothetical protein